MSPFNAELTRRLDAWRAQSGRRTVPAAIRSALEAEARAHVEANPTPRGPVGFAALSVEQRRAIAALGGKAVHRRGKAHTFTSETGQIAGAIGGARAWAEGKAHRFTSEEAKAAGARRRFRGRTKKRRAEKLAARVDAAGAPEVGS